MLEHFLSFGLVKGEQFKYAITFQGSGDIDELSLLLLVFMMVVSFSTDAAFAELEFQLLAVGDSGDNCSLCYLLGKICESDGQRC